MQLPIYLPNNYCYRCNAVAVRWLRFITSAGPKKRSHRRDDDDDDCIIICRTECNQSEIRVLFFSLFFLFCYYFFFYYFFRYIHRWWQKRKSGLFCSDFFFCASYLSFFYLFVFSICLVEKFWVWGPAVVPPEDSEEYLTKWWPFFWMETGIRSCLNERSGLKHEQLLFVVG